MLRAMAKAADMLADCHIRSPPRTTLPYTTQCGSVSRNRVEGRTTDIGGIILGAHTFWTTRTGCAADNAAPDATGHRYRPVADLAS